MNYFIHAARAAESAAAKAVETGALGMLREIFGIEPGVATAGAIGAFASLAFIRDLSGRAALLSVICGMGVSLYFTVPVTEYLIAKEIASPSWQNAIALCLGLCGFHVLAGINQLARKWRADPVTTIKDLQK